MKIKYNPNEVELKKYETWLANDYFKSGDLNKIPFTIVIPPPNVTGSLHLGHAWDVSLQDIIIRYKRLKGFDALWIPGMDHAGIATQAKVDERLRENNISPRSLKREEWIKHAWQWKEEYASNIRKQWSKLGLSLDYSKEKFTLDEDLNKIVNETFIKMYEEGLIYRGNRLINWDPLSMTALSNEEVIHKEIKGNLYYLKYQVTDTSDFLEIATSRPETIFGDTAVAVNPNDLRYKKYVGKTVTIPIVNREIPIIEDDYVDIEYGTGVLKVTPGSDFNDFEIGTRHNLESIEIINKDGTLYNGAGKYKNVDRFVARKRLVDELKENKLLIKTEDILHNVGHSERSGAMIEPMLSDQWFVKMRPLADRVLENQLNENTKVNFFPDRYEKIMSHWMEITYDWCISRQLWWGHRIPAYYKDNEIYVGNNPPSDEWIQDEDVLDTWFSSALWPYSTLGYPDNELYKRYYPTNVLVTGYDIIPFWVNRMTFQGLHFTDQRPFKDCLIHGLIRDKDGRKMSKSLGNGVDPMEVIDEYGADALRWFLTTSSSIGVDLRYDEEKVKSSWNFLNKLWNASRYVIMNTEEIDIDINNLNDIDKWIITKLNLILKDIDKFMNEYEFSVVGKMLYEFIWNDFCDNYIELSKLNLNNETKWTLRYVLGNILKLLHPFTPFITDELFIKLNNKSIHKETYPEYNKEYIFETSLNEVNLQLDFIKEVRNILQQNKINSKLYFKPNNSKNYQYIKHVLKMDNYIEGELLAIDINKSDYSITIYYKENVVVNKEEINNIKTKLEESIERKEKLLKNEGFIKNAPKELLVKEKNELESLKEELKNISK